MLSCTSRASLSQNTRPWFIIEQRGRLNRSDTLNLALANVLASCSFYEHQTLMPPRPFGPPSFTRRSADCELCVYSCSPEPGEVPLACLNRLLSCEISSGGVERQPSHSHPRGLSKCGPSWWTISGRSSRTFRWDGSSPVRWNDVCFFLS